MSVLDIVNAIARDKTLGGDYPERRIFENKDYLEELFGLEYQLLCLQLDSPRPSSMVLL